ncbi:hypothetical protein Taro_035685 [Colocasia esculenta]|uniref:Uncharacterized protein n=1 Tax=Colocasia esculenta TaxID=4460 RepID=A0A843W7E6_COLES|nr:hypothetical protein [Colocasia esculenta]
MALVASALLNPVCNRLINFAIEEYGLLRNLKEETESLKSTVSLIKRVLHDADAKQANDEAVRAWLAQLKQILFDAEDILDEVATDALLRQRYQDSSEPKIGTGQKVRNIICCFGCVESVSSDHDMAHRIKAIRLKLDDIYDKKHKLGLQTSVPAEEFRPRRPPTSSLLGDESYIIGRDDEREKVIQLLLGPKEEIDLDGQKDNIQVLVIVGIGGVGKTTLAKLIYNDPRVKKHFHKLMMWVCVSEDFDLKRITREIMEAALSSEERKELFEISNWDLHQNRFKNKIEDKRFLLVLDDLWEEDRSNWETLCEPLLHGAEGSKIIVTTRKKRILNMVKGIPFPLEVMSTEALWPIFRRYAFDNDEPSEKMQLEIVGRQIVKKLKGLPLAAKIIGRLLNESLDMNHWTNILRSEIFTLQQYSDDILPVLKLSYDHLSANLKQCFAYCSLFQKDDIFFEDELISMWMAQNFIQNTRVDLHAEQVGRESINDLFNKSFFEQKNVTSMGRFWLEIAGGHFHAEEKFSSEFMMHDLIHDLAESISEGDCFRLGDDKQKEMSENVRHVSIATDSLDLSRLMKVWKHGNLRTLVFLHQNTFIWTPHLDDLFMKLKRLRTLGLRGCKIEKLPSSIGKLKHLRFVDVSKTLISNLPESLSDLHNLQFVDVSKTLINNLPESLSDLHNLQLDTEIASSVQGLRKLTALQELIVTGSKVGELADMSMLKELRIWGLEGVASKEEAVQARLEAKHHLEVLELKWSQSSDSRPRRQALSEEEIVDALKPVNRIRRLLLRFYEGVRSPKWMADPSWVSGSFLEKIVLSDCTKWEVLPPLSQLPCLKFLIIEAMLGVRRIGPEFFSCCCVDGGGGGGVKLAPGFPSLEELGFYNLSEWEEWESPVLVDQDDGRRGGQQHPLFLPRLRTLRIFHCEKLRGLPPLPPTLTILDLSYVGLAHLPGWMMRGSDVGRDVTSPTSSSSPTLSSLDIYHCPNITSLGSGLLQHPLPMLKYLRISGCGELASLPDGLLLRHLDSLQRLTVRDCPKLSWPPSATLEDALPTSSLEDVQLYGCGETTGELLLGNLSQRLTSLSRLDVDVSSSGTLAGLGAFTSLTHLGIHGHDHVDDGALSTCLQGLTSLKSLNIYNCSAITTLILSSEEVLRRLPALEKLEIGNCAELRSLWGASPALVSLKHLEIGNCPKLFHLVEEAVSSPSAPSASSPVISSTATKISVKSLWIWSCSPEQIAAWLLQVSSLQELYMWSCPQLRCFGDDDAGRGDDTHGGELESALLDLAPSLRQLRFALCENLSSLPSRLRSLSCLERLSVVDCPKIQRLPSAGLPESLEYFGIFGCPELEQRCRKEGSPDWPLLSHIPFVRTGSLLSAAQFDQEGGTHAVADWFSFEIVIWAGGMKDSLGTFRNINSIEEDTMLGTNWAPKHLGTQGPQECPRVAWRLDKVSTL